MTWILLSLLSAGFLGVYDLLKKLSVRDNAVVPVLFFSNLAGAVFWGPLLVWSWMDPNSISSGLYVDPVDRQEHALLFAKAALVSASWIFGYFALKHLPLSIAGPIRSTSPLWTISFALILFQERPTPYQWIGIGIILLSFYAFSLAGKLEGIHFHRDKWVGYMIVGTMLGALSSVYDKYLLQTVGFTVPTVQAWFSIYLLVILGPFALLHRWAGWARHRFEWRWSIPLVGLALLIADFVYFAAVRDPEALISVITPIRRSGVIITFLAGIFWLKEKNVRPKAWCVAGILLGIVILHRG